MPHPTPLVSIITVNFNGEDDTVDLIKSLQESTYKHWELIIVDNNSKHPPEKLKPYINEQIKLIELSENLGFAGGNNAALPHCNGEYYFFVNNDAVLTEACLDTLVSTAEKTENLGALSPKFKYYHSKDTVEFAGCSKINPLTARNSALHNGEPDRGISGLIKTHYAHGAGMLIPKKVIDEVGTMHSDYFLYYEEMDWCERIRKTGFEIYCQRDALIYHKESATVGKLNPMKTFYLNRNRILFMNRNYPFPKNMPFILFVVFISFPVNVLRYAFSGDWEHLRAYVKGVFWHINPKITF